MKPRYIHIGSWNIEHFGRVDDSPNNQYAIAEHIELSGVSILAIQELYITDDFPAGGQLGNKFLRASLDLVEEHTGNHWEYEIFPNRDPSDREQLCGIAWNTARVTKVGDTLRVNVSNQVVDDNGDRLFLWDRHPHAVKFAARPGEDAVIQLTDFVVIPLHMKSNVGQRHVVMRTRYHEARELMAQIAAIGDAFDERDIIVLGDTNCKRRDEGAIQAFIESGFEDLNEDDIPTYAIGNDAPFDRIFIPRGAERKTFRFSRQYILRSASPLAHDKYLSDHYLVKTSIVVRRDDDFGSAEIAAAVSVT